MFSGSVNAGFILALPFHHGKLEPDYVGVLTGELMCGIKIPLLDFALKMQGGGGLFAGHYDKCDRSATSTL